MLKVLCVNNNKLFAARVVLTRFTLEASPAIPFTENLPTRYLLTDFNAVFYILVAYIAL